MSIQPLRRDARCVRVAFVLVPGFSMLTYASAIEPLRAANQISEQSLFSWAHITPNGLPAAASNGVELRPDQRMDKAAHFDFVFVCASDEGASFKDRATLSWLRYCASRGSVLGAMSGGAFVLARAGLLTGRRATLHWAYSEAFAEEFPEIDLRRSLYELDGDRVTCAGGISPLDMMHALLLREHGAKLTTDVTEWFLHTEFREGQQPQRLSFQARLGVSHRGLMKALEAIDNALEEPLSRASLAVRAGVSTRQLDRLFMSQLGTTLGDYYQRIRLQRARSLVTQSNLSMLEIATICGFQGAASFSKAYKRRYGHAPSTERVRYNTHLRPFA